MYVFDIPNMKKNTNETIDDFEDVKHHSEQSLKKVWDDEPDLY